MVTKKQLSRLASTFYGVVIGMSLSEILIIKLFNFMQTSFLYLFFGISVISLTIGFILSSLEPEEIEGKRQ
jgi:putative flippase GtrA